MVETAGKGNGKSKDSRKDARGKNFAGKDSSNNKNGRGKNFADKDNRGGKNSVNNKNARGANGQTGNSRNGKVQSGNSRKVKYNLVMCITESPAGNLARDVKVSI